MSDVLTIIDHGERGVTAIRGEERLRVPLWIAEFVNCGFTRDVPRMHELWRDHVKGPTDVMHVLDFARLVTGLSRAELTEAIEGFLDRKLPHYDH